MSNLTANQVMLPLCQKGMVPFHQFAESLGIAVDARDPYTLLHSVQVAELSHRLAVAMKLPEPITQTVHLAGHLHDIGKIGVPDAILQKQGRPNEEEWESIRRHPEIGARILSPVEGFNLPGGISDIVRAHHEKFDGSGYPYGLAGEEIPLGARIVAVADSLSALIQDRPYRRGCSEATALAEIRRCSGTQFDPQVVTTLISHHQLIMAGLAVNDGAALLCA